MQIAGIPCGVCDQKIVIELEGRGCSRCRSAFHARCLAEAGLCLKCRSSFELEADFASEQEESERAALLARGRAIVIGAIAFLLLGETLGLLQGVASFLSKSHEVGSIALLLKPLLNLAFAFGISLGLYSGSYGARTYLRVISVVASVLCVLTALKSASSGDATSALLYLQECVAFGAVFWALTLSKSVDWFLKRDLAE